MGELKKVLSKDSQYRILPYFSKKMPEMEFLSYRDSLIYNNTDCKFQGIEFKEEISLGKISQSTYKEIDEQKILLFSLSKKNLTKELFPWLLQRGKNFANLIYLARLNFQGSSKI